MSSLDGYRVKGPLFEHFGEMLFIGVKRRVTPETHQEIGAVWQSFVTRIEEIENTVLSHPFGVCVPIEGKQPYCMDYLAAMSVSNFSFVPKGMNTCVVPEGEYAVFTHVGSLDFFSKTMDYIFRNWLPNADVQHRGEPEIEVYDHRFDHENRVGEIDYRVPVTRR